MTTTTESMNTTNRQLTKEQTLRLAADASVDPKTVERWAAGSEVRRGTRERLEASWTKLGYGASR